MSFRVSIGILRIKKIKRVNKMRRSLDELYGKLLTEEEWRKVEDLVALLEPFKDVSDALETSKRPPIQLMAPFMNQLLNHLQQSTHAAKAKVLQKLQKYWPSTTKDALHIGTFFHPSFRQYAWPEEWRHSGLTHIRQNLCRP